MAFLEELQFDIQNGATAQEISSAYPELKQNTKLISELQFDIQNGATSDEINKAYPEISQPVRDTSLWGAFKQQASNLWSVFTESLPAIASNIGQWARQFGADISKLQRGEFKKEIVWQQTDNTGIKKGFLWNLISDTIQREKAFTTRKQEQWDIGQTVGEKWLDKLWEWFWVAKDVIWNMFMSGLKTITTEKQKQDAMNALQEIADTEIGKKGIAALWDLKLWAQEFERQNPRLWSVARNVWNIWGVTLDVATAWAWKQLLKQTWKNLESLGGKTVDVAKQGVDLTKQGANIAKQKIIQPIKPFAKKSAWNLKQTATRDIPESVISKNLWFTPTERANIEKIVWKNEWKYILEKWLWGQGKEEMINVFSKQVNDNFKWLKTKLSKLWDTPKKSDKTTQALEDILGQLTASKKLKNFYKDDILATQRLLDKGKYTLLEKHLIRQSFDKVNNGLYNAKWQARWGIEKAVDIDIRNTISKELERDALKLGVDVAEMNRELRVWIEMRKALLRRLSQEQKNNFIWLQDIWVSAILSWGDPVTATALIWSKKYLESLAPKASQKLFNLNKTKDAPRNLNRNATVTNSSSSSGLGFASNLRDNMAKSSKTIKKPTKLTKKKVVAPKKKAPTNKVVKKPVKKTKPQTKKTIKKPQIVAKKNKVWDNKVIINKPKKMSNYKQAHLDSLIKEAKATWKMPLNDEIAKWFITPPKILQRKAFLDEIKAILKKEANIKDFVPNKILNPIERYTKHQGRINSYLRNPNGWHLPETKQLAKLVEQDILKLPKYEWVSYRWVKTFPGLDALKVWDTFIDKWFTSSSKSKIVADRFADDALFIIKGKNGRDLSSISKMKSEQEILFTPNVKFKIVDVKTKWGKKIITLTQNN